MKVELIQPFCIHKRTIPCPIGSVIDFDDWKAKELIEQGIAVEYGVAPKKELKKVTKKPAPERESDNPELQ